MAKRVLAAIVAAIACALPSSGFSEQLKVGMLSDVKAWINKMPSTDGVESLHVIGHVVVKNACYEAETSFTGIKKSNPPILMIKVSLVAKPGVVCIQVEGQERYIDFSYDDPHYTEGDKAKVEVSSDVDSKEVPIDIVH